VVDLGCGPGPLTQGRRAPSAPAWRWGSQRAEFVAAYGNALLQAYPREPFGTVFTFRRIFAVAHKRESLW